MNREHQTPGVCRHERNLGALRWPATGEELEVQLAQAAGAIDAGKGVNGETALRRLRERIKGTRG